MEKIQGIVIKEVKVKDNDKIITVFAKGLGKVSLYARGARKIKSPFLAGTQLFSYGNFVLSGNKEMKYISQIDNIDSFHKIRNDINRLYLAMYFVEVVDKVVVEEHEEDELLFLLLNSLKRVEFGEMDFELLRCIFELRTLCILGFTPDADKIKASSGTVHTIRHITTSKLSLLFAFKVDKYIIRELRTLLNRFMEENIDAKFRTLEYL